MQEVNSNILIQRIEDYVKNNEALLELEVTNLRQKFSVAYDEFSLPLAFLKQCSVSQKIYSNFFILLVKDSEEKTISVRLVTDKNEFYQITCLEEKKENSVLMRTEEYMLGNQNLDLVVNVQQQVNAQENIFTIASDRSDYKDLSCLTLKETAILEINQAIENLLDYNNMKGYKIHRKIKAN